MNAATGLAARRPTRRVRIGGVWVGGGAPIAIQGMTNVFTRDVDACVGQIQGLIEAGCEIVRVAAATKEDTAALPEILRQVSIPVVADVHFHYQRALEAVAAGVAKIRLNPGNIHDRRQVEKVLAACRAQGVAVRVGVNQGSLGQPLGDQAQPVPDRAQLVERMTARLRQYVQIFADNRFEALVLSAKCHDAGACIAVNRAVSAAFDYPLHLGVTHAGDVPTGGIRSAAALGALLAEGIGDTVRVSLAGDPRVEVEAAWEVLTSLGLRPPRGPQLIACPTCGRTEVDLLGMVERVREGLKGIRAPLTVAVMGCVVNGPGEAAGADVALCGGRDRVMIYRRGRRVATVAADQAVAALLKQVKLLLETRDEAGAPGAEVPS